MWVESFFLPIGKIDSFLKRRIILPSPVSLKFINISLSLIPLKELMPSFPLISTILVEFCKTPWVLQSSVNILYYNPDWCFSKHLVIQEHYTPSGQLHAPFQLPPFIHYLLINQVSNLKAFSSGKSWLTAVCKNYDKKWSWYNLILERFYFFYPDYCPVKA